MARKKIEAIAYLRTSSPTNASKGLSADKDSDKRQRAAIIGFSFTRFDGSRVTI